MTRVLLALSLVAVAACDPVHSDARDALGGEAQGTRPGPNHRPGQPCLICHDGAIGDPSQFSVAGTIYKTVDGPILGGVDVILTDATGSKFTTTTNAAGNFYVTPSRWSPTYPMSVEIDYGGANVKMRTRIGRDGSCGGCHTDPPSAASPGHVAFFWDGGSP